MTQDVDLQYALGLPVYVGLTLEAVTGDMGCT